MYFNFFCEEKYNIWSISLSRSKEKHLYSYLTIEVYKSKKTLIQFLYNMYNAVK